MVRTNMVITLNPEQEAWLKTRVESGVFASVEDGVRRLVDDRISEIELEADDLSWAKPYVDEAIAAVERGEHVTLDEHKVHMSALLASLKP